MFDLMSSHEHMGHERAVHAQPDRNIVTHGLMAGTRVASNLGWRSVEALAPGDKVLTFDNGMQTVVEVRREKILLDGEAVPTAHWPMVVPAGVLGNRVDLTLLPEQGVLMESDVADEVYDDPFAVVDAAHLEGLRGTHRVAPRTHLEVVTLVFETDEVIYAEGGALLHCPRSMDLLDTVEAFIAPVYPKMSADVAAIMLDELLVDDALRLEDGPVRIH